MSAEVTFLKEHCILSKDIPKFQKNSKQHRLKMEIKI